MEVLLLRCNEGSKILQRHHAVTINICVLDDHIELLFRQRGPSQAAGVEDFPETFLLYEAYSFTIICLSANQEHVTYMCWSRSMIYDMPDSKVPVRTHLKRLQYWVEFSIADFIFNKKFV